MKSLQKLANAQKGRYYTLLYLSLAIGIIIILQAYLIVSIVDDVFLKKLTFQQILPMLLGLFGVLLIRATLSYWVGRIGVRMAAKVKGDHRKKLLHAYTDHSLMTSYKGQSGQKVSILMEAVDELDSYFSKYVPQRILSSVVPLLILAVVFSQHLYSGLIIVLTAPFIPLFMIIIGRLTQRKSEEQLDQLAAFSGRFLDTLQGLISLKLYGRSKQQKEVIRQSSIDFRDATMKILKIAFTSSLMLEFISMLSIGLVALELGLRLVVFEQVSFFTAFFILLLVPEFFASLKELGSAFHAGRSSMGAAVKVEQELDKTDQKVEWGSELLSKTPPLIQLQNVEFQYSSGEFTLRDIRTQIPPYGQVAIVGKSGSGKTTLLHLLAGLLTPSAGEILINGRPRSNYKEQEWFRHISYITQHPYLFAGTIKDNIALGVQEHVTQHDIEEAAVKAGIDEMIQSLEQGYGTLIGEGGRGLSGGEKQRIALARAFLKKPSIILFDEPTTGLDLYTEQLLQKSMRELAQTSTVITVAHRLQTIQHAKQILFLSQGVLIAEGTHDTLMTSVKEYRELFFTQGKEGHR